MVSRDAKRGLFGRMIFQRLPVDGMDFAVFADALVAALAALFAQPAAFDHFRQKRLHLETVAERIVRNRLVEILRDVRPDVEAHDIEQAVAGAFRQADQLAR